MERSDRDPGRGRWLLTMVKSGLSYSRLPNPTSLEALVISVKLQTRSVTIVNVCHAPNVSFDEVAYRQLVREYSQDVIILGDLNAYSSLFGVNCTNTEGEHWKISLMKTTWLYSIQESERMHEPTGAQATLMLPWLLTTLPE